MSGTTVTASDVVNIIKAAKNSGVTKLKYADLELEFDTNFHPNKTKFNTGHKEVTGDVSKEPLSGALLESSSDQPPLSEDNLLFSEIMDQMNIENPAEHEELQLKLLNKGS